MGRLRACWTGAVARCRFGWRALGQQWTLGGAFKAVIWLFGIVGVAATSWGLMREYLYPSLLSLGELIPTLARGIVWATPGLALTALVLFALTFEYLFRLDRAMSARFAPKGATEEAERDIRAAIAELRAERLLIIRRGALHRRLRSAQHAQVRIPQLAEDAKARSVRARLGGMDVEYFGALRAERSAAMRAVLDGLAQDLTRGVPNHDEIPRNDPILQRALADEPEMETRQDEYRWWTLQPPNDALALRFIIPELERELANVQARLEDFAA